MSPFVQQLKNLGPARLAAMGGVAVGLIGFIIFFATKFSAPEMELLYGNLSTADSREIVKQLELTEVPFQTRDDGESIWVSSELVTSTRLQMAKLGIPAGGSMGYELFDQMDPLGTTDFMQNVNLVRALEGELARTIKSIDSVQSARVHLVLAKREMFSREMQEPTASVYVRMKSGRLSTEQIQSVQHLIAAAVPRMKPSSISIVDERGTLLSRGFEDEEDMTVLAQEEKKLGHEKRLKQAIEDLLGSTLGPGKVRVEVRADMDFDRVVTEEEIFDPDQVVPRSTVTVTEELASLEEENDTVTVGNNVPDGALNGPGGGANPRAQTSENRSEETVNYEISKRTVNQIRDTGIVRRLSVAVLVDGDYIETQTEDGESERVYQPRSEAVLNNIDTLVRSAIGFDANRGDVVEVVNMQFVDLDGMLDAEPEPLILGFTKEEIMRMAEGLGVAIVAVLVILLVVRPLVTRAFESMPQNEEGLLTADAAVGGELPLGPGGVPMPVPGGEYDEEEEEDIDELIDIDKVEGRVKASSLRKIGDIVDKHPEEALSIIRNWLYQDS